MQAGGVRRRTPSAWLAQTLRLQRARWPRRRPCAPIWRSMRCASKGSAAHERRAPGLSRSRYYPWEFFNYLQVPPNQLFPKLTGLQRRKEDLMKHAGRAASAAEKQRVLDDVAAVQADSSQADVTLQVRCSRQLPCPVSVHQLCAASPASLCGRRQSCMIIPLQPSYPINQAKHCSYSQGWGVDHCIGLKAGRYEA